MGDTTSELKLNLGCGRDVKPGFVNVDRFPAPGVLVASLEKLPFEDGSASYVLASHVLEHVIDFAATWREIHRVLRLGGRVHVRVPYGYNTDPFHIRYFDEKSIDTLTKSGGPVGYTGTGTSSLERELWWKVIDVNYLYAHDGFPRWHVSKYLGWRLPFAKKIELAFTLEKVS